MKRALTVLCVCFALSGAACSGGEPAPKGVRTSSEKPTVRLPSRLMGLEVVPEDVSGNLESLKNTYVDSIGLFSFRESDELLRATLQVGRFNAQAEDTSRFRSEIVGQMGSTVPRQLRLGGKEVWLSSGSDQNIFAWFDGSGFYVLSIRSDYPFPRTMLRKLVETEILA